MAVGAAQPGARGIAARGVVVRVGDKVLLDRVDLEVAPGELCAVIGVSGSGKSTLLRTLAGVDTPNAGVVAIDGAPASQRAHTVGYVPFGDLVHPQLTVREALLYAAALRLPEAADHERAQRVGELIEQLRMEARAEQLVGALSDGERRRVACGSELVGAPAALVLDEPTTGLDPDLTRRMMLFLRDLADRGLAVTLSTHATGSLDLCDRIAVMAPGGHLQFTGTRDEVLAHYGEATIDDVYDDVHARAQPPRRPESASSPGPPAEEAELPPLQPLVRQAGVLASRYGTCLRRQPRSLALLVGQAPLIGLAIALVLPKGGGAVDLTPFYTLLLAFTLAIGAIWMGVISACREIAGELPILRREVAVGVRLDAYVLSKCLVLAPIVVVQVALLLVPVLLVRPLELPPRDLVLAAPVLVAAGLVGAMVGLVVSALVRSAGQATSVVPLVMIPQLLFSGALISRSAMTAPMRLVTDLMPARWTLSSIGSAFHLDELVGGNLGGITGLQPSFFDVSPVLGVGILLGAGALLFLVAAAALAWRLGDDTPGD